MLRLSIQLGPSCLGRSSPCPGEFSLEVWDVGPWRVSDVMTTDVVAAREDTPVGEIADLLAAHRVTGVPIVGDDRRVLGLSPRPTFCPRSPPPARWAVAGEGAGTGQPRLPPPPPGSW
jgi:hypothetical protein